jgi:4-hydroxy-2-oxoheptanedioate aldolase
MRARIATLVGLTVLGGLAMTQTPRRLNPVIELLEQQKPVFGLYATANPRAGRGGRGGRGGGDSAGAVAVAQPPAKTPAQLAVEALAYPGADLIFDGSMEGNFDRGYTTFAEFAQGMSDGGVLQRQPFARLKQPLFVKMTKIGDDHALAAERISRQLNLGVAGVVFVDVESAEELRAGLAAMRFKSKGGTRPDAVGAAPAHWGMTEQAYREKADLWPANPNGELVNWTIVESREGLERIREIAAVPGIGALFPGAGTLRGVFTTTNAGGERVFDAVAWEGAIQKVLAACKEFKVACGYPATANDIEERMKQGFSVFIINWGDAGFRTVDIGRRAGGR